MLIWLFSNGWRYGAPIPSGPITLNELYNIIPMNPVIQTVDISGEELLDMLEDNLEKTFAADAYQQQGGYIKRCMGLKVLIKIEAPKGHRIQQLFVHNEPVNLHKAYHVAFVTEQGVAGKYGKNRKETGIKAVDAMRQYLNNHSPVRIELLGTFVAV